MLGHSANEVVRYTDVERSTDTTGEYVNVEATRSHRPLEYWVARSSRAMTVVHGAAPKTYSPACSLRGSGNSSGVAALTRRGASTGASALLKSSSSIRPARFSILSAEIRIWRTSSLASAKC